MKGSVSLCVHMCVYGQVQYGIGVPFLSLTDSFITGKGGIFLSFFLFFFLRLFSPLMTKSYIYKLEFLKL